MTTTSLIPATLPRTLDDVRARLLAELGTVGIPNLHWPLPTGNDCLAFLTWAAGIRARDNLTTGLISIRAFRATAGWHEVGPNEVRPGDWALWNWDDNPDPDHAEFVYSVDRPGNGITTVSANTGPKPGVDIDKHPELRGVYRKTRDLDDIHLWGALRPHYLDPATTSTDRKNVRAVGTYLNRIMPATYHDPVTRRTIPLHRTGAGDIGTMKGDGKRGPLYRLLVQVWGRQHRLYGDSYRLDGIFGRRSEYVEEHLIPVAKAAK